MAFVNAKALVCKSVTNRGVQYVHWVMYKCIMVKVGGKRNTHKVCKKEVNFSKTGGEICQSRGKFFSLRDGGKCSETGKIGGIIEMFGRQLEKGHQKFWRMKIEK